MKQEKEQVKVICAWCDKDLGTKEMVVAPGFEGVPTHGMCKECLDNQLKEMNDGGK